MFAYSRGSCILLTIKVSTNRNYSPLSSDLFLHNYIQYSFINVSLHHKDDQTLETLKKFTIYVMETTRLFAAQPIDTACVVFNMTDFSLSHMDMDYVKFLISCFEAYYPESLGVCLVHRAPWIFSSEYFEPCLYYLDLLTYIKCTYVHLN